jgi:folate-binding protein YgfZ
MTIQASQLSHLSLLIIEGKDSKKFLQGQITCDTNDITGSQFQYGAHCNNKGRAIANFIAATMNSSAEASETDTVVLRVESSIQATLQASLAKYMVFSKAEIQPKSDSYLIIGLQGDAMAWLKESHQISFPKPSNDSEPKHLSNHIIQHKGAYFLALDEHRVECWIPAESVDFDDIFKMIDNDRPSTLWLQADIDRGIGWISEPTSEMFIPQMLNFDTSEISGINFKKGCYTGQEIIARMHYKGTVKRRLQHLKISSDKINILPKINIGQELYGKKNQQSIGNIVSVNKSLSSLHILAVCVLSDIEDNAVYLDKNGVEKLERCMLPYAITT